MRGEYFYSLLAAAGLVKTRLIRHRGVMALGRGLP